MLEYKFSDHLRKRFCERIFNLSKQKSESFLNNQSNANFIDKTIHNYLLRAKKVEQINDPYFRKKYKNNNFLINLNKNIVFVLKDEKIIVTCYKLYKHYSKEKQITNVIPSNNMNSKLKQKMFAYNNYSYLRRDENPIKQ